MLISDDLTSIVKVSSDFTGGMFMDVDPSQLSEGKYRLLINGRSRNNVLKPVKLPRKESSTPNGNHQGLFSAGSALIVLINGVAYYRDFGSAIATFGPIGLFSQMDASVDTIWGELVPASTINYVRTAADANSDIKLTDGIDGSPRALVLQDGISRPRIVEPAFTSRLAQDFGQWKLDEIMEYVPIGKQMKFKDGKLYIVAANGTEIYHSLTGRPLDFVIAVDGDGNKFPPGDFNEEAERLSHKVDWEPITCLNTFKVPTDSGVKSLLFVGTAKTSYIVSQVVDGFAPFGESTFANDTLFALGPLNQNSFVELLGDYAIVSDVGVRLFNSVIQTSNDGANAPLTLAVQFLFEGIVQSVTAAINFDNYGMFAVKTVFGNGILVYDYNRRVYVALDIYPNVGAIKQFAEVKVNGVKSLWFITATGLYEAFMGSTATMQMMINEYDIGHPNGEHRINRVQPVLQNIEEAGTISVTEFADRKKGAVRSKSVTANYTKGETLTIPFGTSNQDVIRNPTLPFSYAPRCRKAATLVEMNFMAELLMVQTVLDVFVERNAEDEKKQVYK